jgi:hypothetical protein
VVTEERIQTNRRSRRREGEGRVHTGQPIQHCSCGSHSAGIRNPIFAGHPAMAFTILPSSLSVDLG